VSTLPFKVKKNQKTNRLEPKSAMAELKKLSQQFEKMQENFKTEMKSMTEKLRDLKADNENLEKRNDELEESVRKLKENKETSTKEDKRELSDAITTAKEQVPLLTEKPHWPGNWATFKNKIDNSISLTPKMEAFINSIKATGDDVSTVKELPTDPTQLEALVPSTSEEVSKIQMQTFYAWLRNKVDEDVKFLYNNISKTLPAKVRVFVLWTNILNKFGVNNVLVREQAINEFNAMKQEEEERFDAWTERVRRKANDVNELHELIDVQWKSSELKKIDEQQVFSRIRHYANSYYGQILEPVLSNIDTQYLNSTLDQKLTILRTRITNKNIQDRKPTEDKVNAEYANMARTNRPSNPAGDSEFFYTRLHKDQAKQMVCFKYNGQPGSCPRENTCRFAHIQDSQERKKALESNSYYSTYKEQGDRRRNRERSDGRRGRGRGRDRRGKSRRGDRHRERDRERERDGRSGSESETDREDSYSSNEYEERKFDRSRRSRRGSRGGRGRAYVSRERRRRRREPSTDYSTRSETDDYEAFHSQQRIEDRIDRITDRDRRSSSRRTTDRDERRNKYRSRSKSRGRERDYGHAGLALGHNYLAIGRSNEANTNSATERKYTSTGYPTLTTEYKHDNPPIKIENEHNINDDKEICNDLTNDKIENEYNDNKEMHRDLTDDNNMYNNLSIDDTPELIPSSDSDNSSDNSNDKQENKLEVTSRRMKKREKRRMEKERRARQARTDKEKRAREREEERRRMEAAGEKENERNKKREEEKEKKRRKKKKKNNKKKNKKSEQQAEIYEEFSEYHRNLWHENADEEEEGAEELWKEITKELKKQTKTTNRPTVRSAVQASKIRKRNTCSSIVWTTFRILAFILMSVSILTSVGAGCIKYVGFGFMPQSQAASTVAIGTDRINFCFMARSASRGVHDPINKKHLRIIDCGATWHISGEEGIWVGKRRRLKQPKTISGFDSESQGSKSLEAYEEGTVEFPATVKGRPTTVRVKNVLYIPTMGNVTLISQGMLDDQGHKFTTTNGVTSCYNRRGVMKWNAHKRDGLYHFDHTVERCMLSMNEAHTKFGHINEKDLSKLGDFEGELSP
jgi:hypothetical protein